MMKYSRWCEPAMICRVGWLFSWCSLRCGDWFLDDFDYRLHWHFTFPRRVGVPFIDYLLWCVQVVVPWSVEDCNIIYRLHRCVREWRGEADLPLDFLSFRGPSDFRWCWFSLLISNIDFVKYSMVPSSRGISRGVVAWCKIDLRSIFSIDFLDFDWFFDYWFSSLLTLLLRWCQMCGGRNTCDFHAAFTDYAIIFSGKYRLIFDFSFDFIFDFSYADKIWLKYWYFKDAMIKTLRYLFWCFFRLIDWFRFSPDIDYFFV